MGALTCSLALSLRAKLHGLMYKYWETDSQTILYLIMIVVTTVNLNSVNLQVRFYVHFLCAFLLAFLL